MLTTCLHASCKCYWISFRFCDEFHSACFECCLTKFDLLSKHSNNLQYRTLLLWNGKSKHLWRLIVKALYKFSVPFCCFSLLACLPNSIRAFCLVAVTITSLNVCVCSKLSSKPNTVLEAPSIVFFRDSKSLLVSIIAPPRATNVASKTLRPQSGRYVVNTLCTVLATLRNFKLKPARLRCWYDAKIVGRYVAQGTATDYFCKSGSRKPTNSRRIGVIKAWIRWHGLSF